MTLLLVALTAALAAEHLLFRFVLRPKRGEFLKSGKQGDNAAAVAAVSGLSVLGGYLLAFLLTGSCALLPSAGLTLLLSAAHLRSRCSCSRPNRAFSSPPRRSTPC